MKQNNLLAFTLGFLAILGIISTIKMSLVFLDIVSMLHEYNGWKYYFKLVSATISFIISLIGLICFPLFFKNFKKVWNLIVKLEK